MEDDPEQGLFSRIKSFVKKRSHRNNSNDLAEEIQELVDEGQAKGLISNEESLMVHGVLDLKDTNARSIMIPRTEISAASINSTTGELTKLVRDCGHTRIPIHKGNIDEIVGILHAKDLLKLWGYDPSLKVPIEILRSPYFVPETKKISELLRDLKEKKTHLAIVTDEYGGTAGIITIEDILEEIVGEIMDEHDNEEPLIKVIDNKSVLVDARLDIKKLQDYLHMKLPEGDFDSAGGFIIHLLGKIPEVNEKISFGELELIIQKANQRKIDKILIKKKNQPYTSSDKNTHI